ncbi:hypothetical protein CPIN18021_0325 [Campylobacter pinnipediorum subsp. caledonicus]|uniref:Uncharacterized protein n=1 Tax=Campylobacter pinnipediorum subsp. caledonicus TaxID=1874362 RepID=A0A1S6U655_9BACT|nr:hypothetical protein [Campylobacter pinnipediorum]AQW85568.1 hypothetical protein CPIN18020_0327 [Campylobacter pinnipediorum subsp. caledonicus]AQW87172.1 hypothetical protein CPIN18021_0325 [Campylobacter pinnipediorum subsp. caledonicus]OPA71849.1 hypothetical protein BB381_06855 [Campylobacter pinnipediorum subsp. caledonicus]
MRRIIKFVSLEKEPNGFKVRLFDENKKLVREVDQLLAFYKLQELNKIIDKEQKKLNEGGEKSLW